MKYLINGLVRIVTAIDWPMMLILMVLASAGMLVMHSAVGGTDWRFAEQLRNFAVALVALWVVALIPQPVYMKFALPCYVLGLGLLVAVMLFGDTSNTMAQYWHWSHTTFRDDENRDALNVGVVFSSS